MPVVPLTTVTTKRPQGPRGRTGEYSPRLAALGRFTIRHKGLVIAAWIGAAVLLAVVFPQLESVVRQQSVQLLPNDVASFRAFDDMATAFDERGAKTSIIVAMEDPQGLTSSVRHRYDELVAALRADTTHVLMVQDLLADPTTKGHAISADGKAWFLPVGIAGTLGDPKATEAVDAVRAGVASAFAGTPTTAHVTGPPTTFHDQIATGERDAHIVSIATAAIIALILLLVYRSVFTALLPLLVIGVSLVVARGILSGLGEAGVPVSQFTITFLVAILLGAGTDYSVFLISRYHEQRRQGIHAEEAIVAATGSIGRVIMASAATVALAFAAMVFARLSVFQGLGPACAVAVLIGFLATVTLLPPVLALAARHGIGEPRADLSRRHWNRVAVAVVRRPWPLLTASVVVLLALSGIAATMKISYDDRAGQPADTDSNQGYQLLDRHFPKDAVISQFLLLRSDTDMRTAKGLADLDELASRITQLPGVTRVSGVTRPTGKRLDQAQLSWQNGRIGDKMAGAVADGQAHRDDLAKLTDGADQLAAGLGQLDTTLRRALTPLTGLLSRAQTSAQTLQSTQPLLRQLGAAAPTVDQAVRSGAGLRPLAHQAAGAVGVIEPLVDSLDASPWCAATPQCAQLRDETHVLVTLRNGGFFDQVAAFSDQFRQNATVAGTLADVEKAASTMQQTLDAAGEPADLVGKVHRLQDGVSRLASGAQALATGVHTLADSNIQLLGGMSQVATALQNSARATADSDAASGFYLPPDAFGNRQFSDLAAQFVSPDGRTARFAITSSYDPFSAEAMALNRRIIDTANAARPNTSLADTSISVAGFPAVNSDLQQLLSADFKRLAAATLLIVGVILILLLRAIVAPLYLLGTVVLNYFAALGLGVLVFQYGLGHDIAWPVPLLAFILLVAVGADYNMLLVSRLREESMQNMRVGVLRTVASTGSVITSAGVIFAASMFGLIIGSVDMMVQAGFVIGCGLLLDTFVVRTITVPAIATLLREKSWWPHR
ncbi:putative RND superfamily drug exporter [Mycolicibacterium chubuense NBB4]|uniref:Putative RND superfamily drug exporter n=1 Tax=Mycolicibacterium chubuense (strain NBB4) TaxID=710421 RepID=I4BGR0_MYCCN|nr:putative RND superfamily drug exporter [Mycolicibacterium chubuense NBB4]